MQYTLRATKEKSLIGTQTVLRPRRSGCIYLDKDIQHKLRKKMKPPDGMQTAFRHCKSVSTLFSVPTELLVSSCSRYHVGHEKVVRIIFESIFLNYRPIAIMDNIASAKKGNLHIPEVPAN